MDVLFSAGVPSCVACPLLACPSAAWPLRGLLAVLEPLAPGEPSWTGAVWGGGIAVMSSVIGAVLMGAALSLPSVTVPAPPPRRGRTCVGARGKPREVRLACNARTERTLAWAAS